MIWSETGLDDNHNAFYYICKICGNYPALCVEFIDSDISIDKCGPFCQFHWNEEIKRAFGKLCKKLDNEDWGSSPETRGEVL